jgi:hypothetical protein
MARFNVEIEAGKIVEVVGLDGKWVPAVVRNPRGEGVKFFDAEIDPKEVWTSYPADLARPHGYPNPTFVVRPGTLANLTLPRAVGINKNFLGRWPACFITIHRNGKKLTFTLHLEVFKDHDRLAVEPTVTYVYPNILADQTIACGNDRCPEKDRCGRINVEKVTDFANKLFAKIVGSIDIFLNGLPGEPSLVGDPAFTPERLIHELGRIITDYSQDENKRAVDEIAEKVTAIQQRVAQATIDKLPAPLRELFAKVKAGHQRVGEANRKADAAKPDAGVQGLVDYLKRQGLEGTIQAVEIGADGTVTSREIAEFGGPFHEDEGDDVQDRTNPKKG